MKKLKCLLLCFLVVSIVRVGSVSGVVKTAGDDGDRDTHMTSGEPLTRKKERIMNIYDKVNNPKIVKVGSYWDVWGYPRKISLDGNYGYISVGESDEGIQIIDISDPAKPKYAGGIGYGWIYAVDARNNIAYCGPRGGNKIDIWDCTDKMNPLKIGELPVGLLGITGNYLVISNGGNSHIYDITNSRKPKLVTKLEGIGVARIDSGFAYGTKKKIKEKEDPTDKNKKIKEITQTLVKIDLSKTDGNVEEIGKFTKSDKERGLLYVFKDYYYVGNPGAVIEIYSKVKPSDGVLKPMKTFKLWEGKVLSDDYRAFDVQGKYAYFINYGFGYAGESINTGELKNSGLWMLDVSKPEEPKVVGRWGYEENVQRKAPMIFENMTVRGNLVYIVDGLTGIRILDVSDVTKPKQIGFYKCGGEMVNLYITEKRAYVSEYNGGAVIILDISNKKDVKYLGHVPGGNVYNFDGYKDEYLYYPGELAETDVGGFGYGLCVADVKDPSKPKVVNVIKDGGGYPMRVKDNLLLTSAGIFSLAEPSNPVLLSRWPVRVSNFIWKNNYVYTAWGRTGGENNFKVIDIATPSMPRVVKELTISADDSLKSMRHMQIVGNKLYIASAHTNNCISVLDISNPANPKLISEYNGLNGATDSFYGFYIKDNFLYTLNYYGELAVYDINQGLDKAKCVQSLRGFYAWDIRGAGKYIYIARFNELEIFEIK